MKPLLQVENLHTYFHTEKGTVKAVNGVSFSMEERRTLALVGESGSGKSVTAMSIMGLIPSPPGEIAEGRLLFDGKSLLDLSEKEIRTIRGDDMAMIFQEPMTSLNPALKIGYQLGEPLKYHKGMNKEQRHSRMLEILKKVELPDGEALLKAYPHELSGGQRQRVMIAMALINEPKLLIADEPTTALDVTVQAQVLRLMEGLKRDFATAILLITHDLGVVAEMADEVAIMYAGRIVEKGSVYDIFDRPAHPYTLGLLKAKPGVQGVGERLYNIPGSVPNPIDLGEYCYFYDRCPKAHEACKKGFPPMVELSPGHCAACRLYEGETS